MPATPVDDENAPYDIGSPTLTDLYISPGGSDSQDGRSRGHPLQTIGAAWSMIPTGSLNGSGYRLNFLPGAYPCEGDCINYFSDRTGTASFPIIFRAEDGRGTVILKGGLNLANVHYLYLLDLTLWAGSEAGAAFGNDVLHVESSDHLLLRGVELRGPLGCITDVCNDMQEVMKANQSEYIYVENSDIAGTYQTSLDFFAVRHGHLLNNHIYRSGGRCAYLKGGSAYFGISGNEFDDCREAGFQAGEGSNLAFMQSPWLHYEVYAVKVVNNVFHDIYGAGLSVTGGYNILMAYNTLYRVGLEDESGRPWALAQVIQGARGCHSAEEFGGDAGTQARCQSLLDAGAWGTSALGQDQAGEWIPNRNIFIMNNIFYNPPGTGTHYVHWVVNGPVTPPAWAHNIPNPSLADDDLVISGNVLWNTLQDDQGLVGDNNGSGNIGCQASNPTCNPAQLASSNHINTLQPQFIDAAHGDFRLAVDSNVFTLQVAPIPDFTWSDAPAVPPVPAGELSNAVLYDRDGSSRSAASPPGAYTGSTKLVYLPNLARAPAQAYLIRGSLIP